MKPNTSVELKKDYLKFVSMIEKRTADLRAQVEADSIDFSEVELSAGLIRTPVKHIRKKAIRHQKIKGEQSL